MRKKILLFLISIFIFGFSYSANAQQLFVDHMSVYQGSDQYCTGASGTDVSFITAGGDVWADSAFIQFDKPQDSYPGGCLSLCASITCVQPTAAEAFGIDALTFEVFKFTSGANPLDPASTPPIKTISLYDIGTCPAEGGTVGTYCAAWDSSYNLNGIFGKTNGQYGFRARVETNRVSDTAGNISIEQTSAYPGQNQIPIQIDVVDIHMVTSSPTVVGSVTGVAAQPYNISYRLSKGAITTIKIYSGQLIRTIVDGLPRVGEGTPGGTLTNEDFWDGRDDTGKLVSAGVYDVKIEASASDEAGLDTAWTETIELSLNPLQITDIAVKPLMDSSTDTASISYMLTEAATVYVDIYPPDTTFTNINTSPPTGPSATRIKRIVEEKTSRIKVTTYWDGRNEDGNPVCDNNNYVYAIWAEIPSSAATVKTHTGVLSVDRGLVLAFVKPSSTVIGSSPSVAGLDPFYFKYTPNRDTYVTARIRNMDNTIVRVLADNEIRFANFLNKEMWDGKDNTGNYVSSGTYLMELVTDDPFQCSESKISTITVIVPVNMFRITDVATKALLGGTSDLASLSFEMTQTMWVDLKIYYPTLINVRPDDWPWDMNGASALQHYEDTDRIVHSVHGFRPGRFKITEYWDGRDTTGLLAPDGQYPFTLVAYSSGAANVMYASDKVMTNGYINITRGQIIFNDFDAIPNIPEMFNSGDVVKLPPYEILYGVSRQSSVTVQILNLNLPPQVIATVLSGGIRDGDIIHNEFWDGKYDDGRYVEGGAYNVRIVAQDMASQLTSLATVQMTIDVYPLRIFDVAIVPLTIDNDAVISYQLSEVMKMVTKIYKPGTSFDDMGNPYPPEATSLVKRIIGVRPARTQITEFWDGTDLSLSRVPDGSYLFKVYGSTVTDGIDSLTGDISSGVLIADDIVISNVPVLRGEISSSSTYVSNTEEVDLVLTKETMEIHVNIEPGTFEQGVTVLITTTSVTASSDPSIKVSPLHIEITNNLNLQPSKDIEISINYSDSDISGMDESKLAIARYSPISRKWVVLNSTIYPGQNRVVARTDHLSVFSLVQPSATTSLDSVRIYPNPFNPVRHSNGVKITNIPAEATLKIYSINGELVNTLTYTTQNGIAQWDGRNNNGSYVASGIYLVLVKSNFGTKTFKLAVEK